MAMATEREEVCRRLFLLADNDSDGFIWRRDLESLCKELDLGYTADAVLPNDHRGRVSFFEFQRYFSRLPESLLYQSSSGSSGSSIRGDQLTRDQLTGDQLTKLNRGFLNDRAAANDHHQQPNEELHLRVMELSARLGEVTLERDQLAREKEKGREGRWESQCQRYEERIIELHSVIAELSKKMEEEKDDVIKEESECDESQVEDSASIATDSFIDEKLVVGEEYEDYTSLAFERDLEMHTRSLRKGKLGMSENGLAKQLLEKEMYKLREQLEEEQRAREEAEARSERLSAELDQERLRSSNLAVERDSFRRQISDLRNTVEYQEAKMEEKAPKAAKEPFLSRFAERRSLRKKSREKSREPSSSQMAGQGGSKLTSSPVEESARGLLNSLALLTTSQGHPLQRSTSTPSPSPCNTNMSLDQQHLQFASKCQEFELEIEKISSHVEHLKAQNAVLALSLEESKSTCDSLTELLGRYESNNTALQISLSYCDHMVESYDVLVALMETEALDEVLTCARTSNRKSAESVARHLLSRLERREGQGRDSGLATSGLDTTWDDSSGYSHTTSSTSTTSSGLEQDFTKQDENRLREHIGRLKVLRAQVQGTVMELESVQALMLREENLQMEGEKKGKAGEVVVTKENRDARVVGSAAELETAVLVQELMAGREERADLRAQVYLLQKEKGLLETSRAGWEAQERVLRVKIQHREEQLDGGEVMVRGGEREAGLRARIEALLATLEKLGRNSELRQQQAGDLIDDLKRANGALTESLDKCRRRYQVRIRRLEQQCAGQGRPGLQGMLLPSNNTDTAGSRSTRASSRTEEAL